MLKYLLKTCLDFAVNRQINIILPLGGFSEPVQNKTQLKTPTGRRKTSWLFTRRGGFDSGVTEDKPNQWSERDLDPGQPHSNRMP